MQWVLVAQAEAVTTGARQATDSCMGGPLGVVSTYTGTDLQGLNRHLGVGVAGLPLDMVVAIGLAPDVHGVGYEHVLSGLRGDGQLSAALLRCHSPRYSNTACSRVFIRVSCLSRASSLKGSWPSRSRYMGAMVT